jgi:hypothetical protein
LAATLVFCAAGCERRPAAPPDPAPATPAAGTSAARASSSAAVIPDPAPATPAAGTVQITVEVKGMTKALNITWREWPNRVEEALSGLPGVTVLDDRDYTKDDIHLRYDPGKVTTDRIIEVIRKQGFEATLVADPKDAPGKPPEGGNKW